MILIACGDNGMSAPSKICFDKKIGYSEVKNPYSPYMNEYSQYMDEWEEGACERKLGTECVSYKSDYTITCVNVLTMLNSTNGKCQETLAGNDHSYKLQSLFR